MATRRRAAEGRRNKNVSSYQYRDSHHKDETVSQDGRETVLSL